jgi:hypothetical protein
VTLILFIFFHPSIVAHHRRSGQVFTQDQEEMILIGAFGLFWFGKSQVRFYLFLILRYCTVSAPYSGMQSRPGRSEELALLLTAKPILFLRTEESGTSSG